MNRQITKPKPYNNRVMTELLKHKIIQFIFCSSVFIHSVFAESPLPGVVIIIDDLGYSYHLGQRTLALPAKLTLAFLPHRPNTPKLAEAAHQLGHEIILHAPMSNTLHHTLGGGALTEQMNKEEFISTLRSSMAVIPHLSGVNNHMGSLLTQRPEPMAWLMQELKQQQLYFIDSRTTAKTIAAKQAETYGVPHLSRQIFLDHDRKSETITAQFERLLKVADQEGIATAIGHPYPETLEVLERVLPTLTLRGYKILLASEALNNKQQPCTTTNPFVSPKSSTCSATLQLAGQHNSVENRQNL
jgi:polysaccharide deacetylase 2 family uncharacterized protein YibQ